MAPILFNPDQASNLTSGLTSALSCLIPLFAFLYIGGIFWTLDYARRIRNPLDKMASSSSSRRYAPSEFRIDIRFGNRTDFRHPQVAYAVVVITSLVVVREYAEYHNGPTQK